MKVDFNTSALADVLGVLTSIIPGRTPKPILRCTKITADDAKNEVRLAATDLEAGINYKVSQIKIERGGETVVEADKLGAIVRESSDEVLRLETQDDTCRITGADSEFTIYSHKPEQFPFVPDFTAEADTEISLSALQKGIGQSLFATAKESSRYAINGILWEIKGKKLLLVATDGRRLAQTRVNLSSAPEQNVATHNIIVPAKTMSLLAKIGFQDNESVRVKFADNKMLMRCASVVISSNLVEGKFPKYEDIIPTDYEKKLKLSTESVLSAVRRAALLTSQESRGIKLSVSKDRLVFSARAPEAGDARVDMAIDYKGQPIDIGFNPQFLIDALRVIDRPDFQMELGEPDRPGVLKSGTDFLYVLMPISLA
jgi:DNA polymerase-3 subunit beta